MGGCWVDYRWRFAARDAEAAAERAGVDGGGLYDARSGDFAANGIGGERAAVDGGEEDYVGDCGGWGRAV